MLDQPLLAGSCPTQPCSMASSSGSVHSLLFFQMSSLIFAAFSITECSSPACMSPQQCSQCQRIMPFAGYTQSLKDKLRIDSRRQGWSALTKITNVTAEAGMRIEIICTGDEILTGKTVNTNFSHISRKLEEV